MDQLDETDTELLRLLTEDARTPIATLARTLGIARTTVQARMDRLERTGVIAGYTVRRGAVLRPAIRATVLLVIEPRVSPAVLSVLRAIPEVKRVHATSGRFDMIAELEAHTTERLDERLDQIGEIRGVRSSESLIQLATKLDRVGEA